MNNSYNLINQKLLQKMTTIDEKVNRLRPRASKGPFISIKGMNHLRMNCLIYPCHTKSDYKEMLYELFTLLNLPISWILSIHHPMDIELKYDIPAEIRIQLITENIKIYVYNRLLNHIEQNKINLKIICH